MFKTILESYKNLDKRTYKILKNGLAFCLIICIISVLILFTYKILFASPFLYYIGISIFRLSIVFGIEFIICALVVDSIVVKGV